MNKVINIFAHILLLSFLWGLPNWDCLIKNRYFPFLFPQTLLDFKRGTFTLHQTIQKSTHFPIYSPALGYGLYKICHSDGQEKCYFTFYLIYFFFPVSELERHLLYVLVLYLSLFCKLPTHTFSGRHVSFSHQLIGNLWYFHITRNII